MKSRWRFRSAAVVLMAGLSLSLGTTGAANASPTPPKPVAADAMSATAKPATVDAACPQPGQRVKQSAYPEVYVVDPDFTLRLIPDATTYFNLWESWGGVVVYDDLVSCYREYVPLFNAHLVKLTTDDPVYICCLLCIRDRYSTSTVSRGTKSETSRWSDRSRSIGLGTTKGGSA